MRSLSFSRSARCGSLAAVALTACGRDDTVAVPAAHAQSPTTHVSARPAGNVALPEIARPTAPYVVRPVADGGSVTGSVEITSDLPIDSAFAPPEELVRPCGARVVPASLGKGAGVAVWLEGVREGKPLPEVRRFEIAIERCQLVPRVQTVIVGGTLHVHSTDPIRSLIRLVRWPAGDTAATVATNNAGEVVPDDRVLASAGTVEAAGLQPSWLRAWVVVLDHPYATTTAAAGTFALDSVPPGQYTLVAWHDRLGRLERPVTVTAGQPANVTLRFASPSPAR